MGRIVDERDYQKGFNLGYQLAELSPEISSIISEISSKDDRIFGMQHGIEQYTLDIEQTKNKTQDKSENRTSKPSWLKNDRIEDIDKETDLNKEKGKDKGIDLEPGI
jgi:hypothetical protein